MVSLRSLATAFAGVALLVQSSLAHSVKRNPISYASLIDDAVIQAPSHRVNAHSHFDIVFTIHNGQQEIRLKLEPNHDLIHDTFAVTHLGADGKVRSVETVERADHKVYKGNAFIHRSGYDGWSNAGWARITVHRDGEHPVFEGSFRIDGDNHHIQTGTRYQSVKHEDDPLMNYPGNVDDAMVVWRDSDILRFEDDHTDLKRGLYGRSACSSDELSFNSQFHQLDLRDSQSLSAMSPRAIFGRQSIDGGSSGNNGAGVDLESTIGSTDGCPTTRKVALVGIATDCTYTAEFNSTETLRKSIISMVNQASQVYESTFNISLGIQNLTVSDKECPGTPPSSAPWNRGCSSSVTITDRLNLFSAWRGKHDDTNAYWTLLSTCNTDSAVGLAWLGQLCRSGSSSSGSSTNETVSSANVVIKTSSEWQVFAHETGHIFGAVHDCTSSTCPVSSGTQSCCPLSKSSCDAKGQFIMNPSTANGITEFSACSVGNICSGFKRNVKSSCLTDNKNVTTITGSQCGNGIVESGEECDCGGESGCGSNSCCDAKTCKLKSTAQCDPTNEDCCTSECKFSSSGTVCRASTGKCDPQETCTGTSASCPSDKHLNDGDDCGDSLYCASGQCTSRDLQCRNMFGNSSITSTSACDSNSGCLMTCSAPAYGYGSCVELNQNFLDGTSCSGGGRCSNGDCVGGSTSQEILDWFKRNKNIVIPVGAAIGALLLIALLSCCYSCIRRRVNRRRAPKPTEMTAWPVASRGANGHNGPPPAYDYAPLPNQGHYGRSRSMRYA